MSARTATAVVNFRLSGIAYQAYIPSLTYQSQFGGAWTQEKLEVLSKYLRAYTKIFERNRGARFYKIIYVDAFAGTGALRTPVLGRSEGLFPGLLEAEEELRKGSARRALEVDPPFHNYVFIEKSPRKCKELEALALEFPNRQVTIVNNDANAALLNWCEHLNTKKERAVVFLDPFGTSVEWKTIEALAKTKAVDVWILFPYSAINRMLVRKKKPPETWRRRLTRVFGSPEWESRFYSSFLHHSLIDPSNPVERTYKTGDYKDIVSYFVERLESVFYAVGEPKPLHNHTGHLLFMLLFAAGNEHGGKAGINIANSIKGT